MQRLEVSGAVRPIYVSLGVKRLITFYGLFVIEIPIKAPLMFYVVIDALVYVPEHRDLVFKRS